MAYEARRYHAAGRRQMILRKIAGSTNWQAVQSNDADALRLWRRRSVSLRICGRFTTFVGSAHHRSANRKAAAAIRSRCNGGSHRYGTTMNARRSLLAAVPVIHRADRYDYRLMLLRYHYFLRDMLYGELALNIAVNRLITALAQWPQKCNGTRAWHDAAVNATILRSGVMISRFLGHESRATSSCLSSGAKDQFQKAPQAFSLLTRRDLSLLKSSTANLPLHKR